MQTNTFFLATCVFLFACSKNQDEQKRSSAQDNVVVLDRKFPMNGLGRERQIRIYLPNNYEKSAERYPVLYMHDGQNLFDDSTSFAGEWGIDESLNELSKTAGFQIIVVGIDNGQEKRMNELSPWENKEFGKAEGKEYVDFTVGQIKPFIDSTYRTLADRENTAIMGSSMGGLISHYALWEYPHVFGKAGIFSPSYWFSNEVYKFVSARQIPEDSRLFILVGGKETASGEMVDGAQKMYETIISVRHPKENVILVIEPDGEHNEAFWRRNFVPAIKWLFKED